MKQSSVNAIWYLVNIFSIGTHIKSVAYETHSVGILLIVLSREINICSKLSIEALEKIKKYVQN